MHEMRCIALEQVITRTVENMPIRRVVPETGYLSHRPISCVVGVGGVSRKRYRSVSRFGVGFVQELCSSSAIKSGGQLDRQIKHGYSS